MTKPKRWPKTANEHRTDAIFAAGLITKKVYEAITAIKRRNTDEALLILREIGLQAEIILFKLESAPAGDDDDDDDDED